MDQERFDRFTRTLASGQSRRDVLKGLTATAIGGLLAAVGTADAGAKGACRAPNTKCCKGRTAQCCPSTHICTPGGCVRKTAETRFVFLTWNPTGYDTHCTATISVSGFAPGEYTGYLSFTPGDIFTIVVGPDGTGSLATGSYTINPGTYVATVGGVSSAPTTISCPAVCGPGYEALNGGCFEDAAGGCTNACIVKGSIDGSGNYLCAAWGTGTCNVTSDCPTGQACSEGYCFAVC